MINKHTIATPSQKDMFLIDISKRMTRCIGGFAIKRRRLAPQPAERPRHAIASGKYQAGQVLTLEGVSAEHGVSRSVAREAIRVLESMGMVASRRRVGITIQPSDKWNVFDPGSFAGGSNPMTAQRFW